MAQRAPSSKKVKRSCDACTGCCVALRIDSKPGFSTRLDTGEDIAKPAGEPCRFLTVAGCGIYDVRPLVCRRFKCDWLNYRDGLGDNESPFLVGYIRAKGNVFKLR